MENNFKILSSTPILVADGHGIVVNDVNGDTNVQFIQVAKLADEKNPTTEVNIVSSVRLNFEQLGRLRDDVVKAINDFESKKPKE